MIVESTMLTLFAEMIRCSAARVVVSSGYYDPMHNGHAAYLLHAGRLAEVHVAVVNGDEALTNKRCRAPFMPAVQRAAVVDAIRGVDFVIVWPGDTVDGVLIALRPRTFAKGGDRTGAGNIPEWKTCAALGIEIVTSVGGNEKAESSSVLLSKWSLGSREGPAYTISYAERDIDPGSRENQDDGR